MNFIRLIYLLIYLILHLSSHAQIVPSIQYNASNGLPASSVYQAIQLKDKSYILLTSEGIIKFDGLNFELEKPLNINYQQSIIAGTLFNDTSLLYYSFREGLFFYNLNKKTSTKENFKCDENMKKPYTVGIRKIHSSENSVFISKDYYNSDKTIYNTLFYDFKKNGCQILENTPDFKIFNSQVYYLSKNKIYKVNNSEKKIVLDFTDLIKDNSNAFCIDKDNNIYISIKKTIFKIAKNKLVKKIELSEINDNEIIDIEVDKFNNLWIITDNYLLYKYKRGALYLIEDGTLKHTLIFIDCNENLCLTSYTDGLIIYYNTFIRNYSKNEGIKNKSINKIRYIDGEHFICTNNGYYTLKNNKLSYKTFPSADIPFIYDAIKQNDNILIATTGKIKSEKIENKVFAIPRRSLATLKNGWVIHSGWDNNIYIDKTNANRFSPFELDKMIALPDTFPKNNFVIGFYQYNDSMVYTYTSVGLFDVNIYNQSYKIITAIKGKVNSVDFNVKKNEFVFCTDNGAFVKKTNRGWHELKKINLPNIQKVSCASIDLRGRWWLGTNKGVYIINNNSIRKLSTEFGLVSNEISSFCLDSINNEMYIGTNNGFSIIDIEQLDNTNLNPPKISVKYIIANKDTILNYRNHTFSPEQNSIQIYLTKVIYPNIKTVKIRYAFDGIWNETNYTNILNFTSLSSDEHSFKIQSSIDGINWSKPTEIKFQIARPFYKSIMFYLAILIISLILILHTSKKIIEKNKKENEQKLQLQAENIHLKFQALNASINPHFIFNALYSIQNFVYNNKANIASNYLAKLSRLIRVTIEQAENIEITLKEEIEKLEFYIQLEKMRFEDRISIIFKNNIVTNPELIKIPNMIIQPLLENAIIHGLNNRPNNGEISVIFNEDNETVVIIIEDNGIGINSAETNKKPNHKSIGLKNVKDRLSLIKGAKISLKDKSELPNMKDSGTIVEITIPKG